MVPQAKPKKKTPSVIEGNGLRLPFHSVLQTRVLHVCEIFGFVIIFKMFYLFNFASSSAASTSKKVWCLAD